jgi:hypothetical protein
MNGHLNTERFLPRIEKIGDTSISGNTVFKEKFFTLSIEWKSITELIDGKYEPKVKMIYWLNSYKENSMKTRVIDPKIISNIEPSRIFQEETKESWKKFWVDCFLYEEKENWSLIAKKQKVLSLMNTAIEQANKIWQKSQNVADVKQMKPQAVV